MVKSYAESSTGLLLIADGFSPVLLWDGQTAQTELAGLAPPAVAPLLAASGAGGIVGYYYAFVRYVDRYNNFSNLSPVSALLTPVGLSGVVTDASVTTPIVLTSAGHGLATGAIVRVVGVGGNTDANNTWAVTVLDADTFSLDGSSGGTAYSGGGTWTSGVDTITYTLTEAVTDPKVTRRQIFRNTDGQASVFYLDVDTTDLTGTTFTSTLTDSILSVQTALPLLDPSGNVYADRFTVPPQHKAVLAQHKDRMFLAVQEDYTLGNVLVETGSTMVWGVGTAWTTALVGRSLYVNGANQPYLIDAVDEVNQALTLDAPYADVTDPFALYGIRPAPGEDRLIYYSEAGLPEAWPATNATSVEVDGDEITGLMPNASWLFILEKRHIYRLTFEADPALDGAIFLAGNRGCVNNRCWVVVDDSAYLLDEQGIHSFGGSQDSDPVSTPIQQIFRPDGGAPYQINWEASAYFHAVLYQPQEVIRWFVALAGERLPRHALCYAYRLKRWWIEEFKVPIGASCRGYLGRVPQVYLGSEARRVFAFWKGTLDGPDPAAGTVRGPVAASGPVSLTDTTATFAAAGLVGSPVSIIAGRGKGQTRIITAVAGQTLGVNAPWLILPDTTSVYQIGGIEWKWRSGWFRLASGEEDNGRRVEAVFMPLGNPCTMDLRVHYDFADAPEPWGADISSADGDGVATADGDSNLVVDLTKKTGVIQKRFNTHREMYTDGRRFSQVELAGFTNKDEVIVWELQYDGMTANRGGGGQ